MASNSAEVDDSITMEQKAIDDDTKDDDEELEEEEELIREIRSSIASLIVLSRSRQHHHDDEAAVDRGVEICRTLSSLMEELQQQQQQSHNKTVTLSTRVRSNDNDNNITYKNCPTHHHHHHPNNFIRTNMDYNNALPSRKSLTIRDVMGSNNDNNKTNFMTTPSLVPILNSLMAHRVDMESLLPATQDEQANQDAMDVTTSSAITLTLPALAAARLYAQLLNMPGAWGSGFNDMEALSCLAAVIRRWSVECRGREQLLQEQPGNGSNNGKSGGKNGAKTKKKKPQQKHGRSKQRNRSASDMMDIDEDDDVMDITNDGPSFHDVDSGKLSPRALVLSGLETARALVQIPLQKEFTSWSYESRETLLEAVICCLATASALSATPSRARGGTTSRQGGVVDLDVQEQSQLVATAASNALAYCICGGRTHEYNNKNNNDTMTSCYHETIVLILRGLTSLIYMQVDTPNGETGKSAAYHAALSALEDLVKAASQEFDNHNNSKSTTTARSSLASRFTMTPRQARQMPSHQTPRTADKRTSTSRLSMGTGTAPTPAALKNTTTPKRRSSVDGHASQGMQHDNKPRPVLSAIVGMFQKLATNNVGGMERANVREGIVSTLIRCMPHLPVPERERLIRFFLQMCESKVPVHRLLGVDVTSAILDETWFWNHHHSQNSSNSSLVNTTIHTTYSCVSSGGGGSADHDTPSLRLSPRDVVEETFSVAMFRALGNRLQDRAPTVRARTASGLANLFRSLCNNTSVQPNNDATENTSKTRSASAVSACAITLHEVLRYRALNDDKATVRKASIDALVELVLFCEETSSTYLRLSADDASLLDDLSRDHSLIVRKAAAEGISGMLLKQCSESDHDDQHQRVRRPDIDEIFEKAWLNTILPMMLDVETSCVSKAVDLFQNIVVEPILDDKEHSRSHIAWRLLSYAGEMSGNAGAATNEVAAIQVALEKYKATESSKGELTLKLLKVICRVASATLEEDGQSNDRRPLFEANIECQRTGVWCLFDALVNDPKTVVSIAQFARKRQIDVDFVAETWQRMRHLLNQPTTPDASRNKLRGSLRSSLRILSKIAPYVGSNRATQSREALAQMLRTFAAPIEVIGFSISSVVAITQSLHPGEAVSLVRNECKQWIIHMLQECEASVSNCLENAVDTGFQVDQETVLARALFTCGELSMVGFSMDEDAITKSASSGNKESGALSGLHVPPSSKLTNLVMALLSERFPTSGATVLIPENVRALAYVTFGKFCLRDEGLAKQSLPIFAGQLHDTSNQNSCSSVHSNALLIMGDLCIRYTNMVDRYLPLMASCLQFGLEGDDVETIFEERSQHGAIVRKHAIVLLSSLLLQDYIKWRGLLFQRFLVAAADNDDEVANLAAETLCGPLLTRFPKLFFNQFVESLFVLNKCTAHPIYRAAAAAGDGGGGIAVGFDGINLSGGSGRIRRHQMYGMMLSKMSDEEKIGVTARIAKEVLGASVEEGDGELGRVCRESLADSERDSLLCSAREVIRDAFAILTPMLRIKQSTSVAAAVADDNLEEMEGAAAGSATQQRVVAAKNRLLSKISSKHLMEIILPKLCTLKRIMEANRSPLLKELMMYLVEVFRTHKSHVRECLSADRVLLQEIEFDARNFKLSQQQQQHGAEDE